MRQRFDSSAIKSRVEEEDPTQMPRRLVARWTLVLAAVGCLVAGNAEASKESLEADVTVALDNLATKIPVAPELIQKAAGILVFPRVYKAGFWFGGGAGEGALRIHGQTVQYYRTTSLSWGFQIGVQWRTEIVMFMTQEALDKFRAGNGWQAGIDGSIAIVAFGVGNSIDTDNIQQPIIGFIFDDKGLMFDLSLKGNKYWRIDVR
jgi:lipid-binding SYLF domain-containing protein